MQVVWTSPQHLVANLKSAVQVLGLGFLSNVFVFLIVGAGSVRPPRNVSTVFPLATTSIYIYRKPNRGSTVSLASKVLSV